MSSIEEIESAVQNLPDEKYRQFRDWLIEYDNRLWDKQMEEDATSGRLDDLASEAIEDLRGGKAKDL